MPMILPPGTDITGGTRIPGVGGAMAQPQGNVLGDLLKQILGMGAQANNPTQPLTQETSVIPGASTPIPQKQYADIKTTPGEFSTISGNKRNAFNNLMGNIKGVVETAEKNSEQQKIRNLSVDMERLMTAVQNPNDPQNAQVINDILGDAKKRKAITKALDISFMGSADKRDPVSKGAMDMAIKKMKEKGSYNPNLSEIANAIMGQMPKATTLTPEMQAREALTKSGVLPKASDQIKQQTDIIKQLSTNDSKERIAQMLANARLTQTNVQQYGAMIRKLQDLMGKKYVADVYASASKYRADKQAEAYKDRTDKQFGALGSNKNIDKAKLESLKTERDTIVRRLQAISNNKKGFDKAGYEKAQRDLEENERKIKALQSDLGVADDTAVNDTGNLDDLERDVSGDSLFDNFSKGLFEGQTTNEDDGTNAGNI